MSRIKSLEDYSNNRSVPTAEEMNFMETKPNNNNTILILPPRMGRHEAIERKLESLKVKILGFTLGKFEVGEMRDVYVPYSLITYSFLIDRKTIFNRNGSLNKHGELNFVFDYNEVHPFQYDTVENGELILKKVNQKNNQGIILPPNATTEKAREEVEWHIHTRVLRRVYGSDGKIAFKSEKKFYRPAVEIKVYYGVNENIRYAYLDDHGVNSEHILGLKYRLG